MLLNVVELFIAVVVLMMAGRMFNNVKCIYKLMKLWTHCLVH